MCPRADEIQRGLLRLYQREFPSREHTQIQKLSRISDGWETDVYSYTVEYDTATGRNREERILRIYPGDDAPQKCAREFNAMEQLFEAGFPVPRVPLMELDEVYFGRPCVIMEKIDGRSMGAVADESPVEKKLELLTRFCRILVDLHTLDWRPFVRDPSLGAPLDASLYATGTVSALVRHELSQWQTYVHALQRHEFDPVFDWLMERIANVRFGEPSVIHMDFHPYNILLREDGAAFVIDWTGIQVSDFRLDLAWTLLLMSSYGNPEVRELVLDEYERVAGYHVEQIEFFEAAACLRRLGSILISLSEGPEKLGMRPDAEAMMADVDHITNVYALLRARTDITIPAVEELLSTLA
jgi:aminoglycoside phosphotransferase (APT) family kinase protein